jgi:hypothetical protein
MEAHEYYKKETGKLYYKEAALELELTDDYVNWLERNVVKLFAIPVVSGSLTPFGESIKLLRDLADLQNGAPLERHRKEWEETMEQVYDFLNRWEGQ